MAANIDFKNKNKKSLNNILSYMNKKGYELRPAWDLISEMKFYKKFPKMSSSQSKKIRDSIINLPSSAEIII